MIAPFHFTWDAPGDKNMRRRPAIAVNDALSVPMIAPFRFTRGRPGDKNMRRRQAIAVNDAGL